MTLVKRAVLKDLQQDLHFLLYRVREKSYRWRMEQDPAEAEHPWILNNESPSESAALVWLRAWALKYYAGADLTFYAVAPAPEQRAAEDIRSRTESAISSGDDPPDCDEIARLIRAHTHLDETLAALNELTAYLATRLADRDPALNPLLLRAIRAVEQATGDDLCGIRKLYESAVERASRRIITN